MDASMHVLFVVVYAARVENLFKCNHHFLIAACVMTGFAVVEPSSKHTAIYKTSLLMKAWLLFEFPHTIVVNKASVFLNVFAKTSALLRINIAALSGKNQDPSCYC